VNVAAAASVDNALLGSPSYDVHYVQPHKAYLGQGVLHSVQLLGSDDGFHLVHLELP